MKSITEVEINELIDKIFDICADICQKHSDENQSNYGSDVADKLKQKILAAKEFFHKIS